MSDASDDSDNDDYIRRQKLREIYVDDYKLEVEDLVPSSKDLVWVLGKCFII